MATEHQHRFFLMGHDYQCVCGATRPDERTDEQRQRDRDLATARFKLRIAEAVAAKPRESFAGDRAAATAHAEQLRTYITERAR